MKLLYFGNSYINTDWILYIEPLDPGNNTLWRIRVGTMSSKDSTSYEEFNSELSRNQRLEEILSLLGQF